MQDNGIRLQALAVVTTALKGMDGLRVSSTAVPVDQRVQNPVVTLSYGRALRAPTNLQQTLFKQSADLNIHLYTDEREGAAEQERVIQAIVDAVDAIGVNEPLGYDLHVAEIDCGLDTAAVNTALIVVRVNQGASERAG